MLLINDTPIMAEVEDILNKLQAATGKIKAIKPTGDNVMVNCPSHKGGNESRPSCGVSIAEIKRGGNTYPAGTVHCFTCGYTANIIEYVSFLFNREDGGAHGYKWIISNFYSIEKGEARRITVDMDRGPEKAAEKLPQIPEEELAKYRFTHDYAYYRKLTDKVINYFDVGFDKKTRALTFPVNDIDGRPVLIQRRAIENKFFQNPDESFKGLLVYGLDKAYLNRSKIDRLWITESIIDALTIWAYGGYAVALMGAIATKEQIKLINDSPFREFIIALDNDKAGKYGAGKLEKSLNKLLYRVPWEAEELKKYKDINQLSEAEFKAMDPVLL